MEKRKRPADEVLLYVSTAGDDGWSGRLPEPDGALADGPFASIRRARDEIRALKASGNLRAPARVLIRGGKYYLTETVSLGPRDSGSSRRPVSYEAYPGESPVISGGVEISGWKAQKGKIMKADIPDKGAVKWVFRSLFADGKRQIRARYPNRNRKNPSRGGFLYAGESEEDRRRFLVMNVFNKGDELEYEVSVPEEGRYELWLLHSGSNRAFGFEDMSGRTSISADGKPPAGLMNLRDTGSPGKLSWSKCAGIFLEKGKHKLTWRNDEGGHILIEKFALCSGGAYASGEELRIKKSSPGRIVIIPATGFVRSRGDELMIYPAAGKIFGKKSFPCHSGLSEAFMGGRPRGGGSYIPGKRLPLLHGNHPP